MKRIFVVSVCLLLLVILSVTVSNTWAYAGIMAKETVIFLSDDGIEVNGGPETKGVYTSRDIIYHGERDVYDSGYPYGEGTLEERHSAQEAAGHLVVNITEPGAYRVTGTLSAGQIRIDLGEDAYNNPKAVVKLILSDTDITCSVAPAILFLRAFECDGRHTTQTASPEIDTTRAGANVILEGRNMVQGSHVAKIFKDGPDRKKLWKQDGAIHSEVSLNIGGSGKLDLMGDKEGICSELHVTVQGGDIAIRAGDDGINASEEKISVVTINDGSVRILSGFAEGGGDGIDSNGYLVINGGTVAVWAPPEDSPFDGGFSPYIHGGTVLGLGAAEDFLDDESRQPSLVLCGEQFPACDSSIVVTDPNGKAVFAFDPSEDEFFRCNTRNYVLAILSSPQILNDVEYRIWIGAELENAKSVVDGQNVRVLEPGMTLLNYWETEETRKDLFYTYANVTYCDIVLQDVE